MRGFWLLAGACLALAGCEAQPDPGTERPARTTGLVDTIGLRSLTVPAEHSAGRRVFDASCAPCHGQAALGTAQGPPLVHIYYEPNHHADIAFVLAVSRGVRAHHWNYGDMPPVPGLTPEDVEQVIGYVRWLQRQAGVY